MLTENEVYVVSWIAAPSLEQRAKRLVAACQRQLDEFWDAVHRGEYGDDYMSVAYCESRDRLQAEWQAAVDRLEIIQKRNDLIEQGAECDCVGDQHCTICDSLAHVTFTEEESKMARIMTLEEWLDDYLIVGVWDDQHHAVDNLVTLGFSPVAAHLAVYRRRMFMQFETKEEETKCDQVKP